MSIYEIYHANYFDLQEIEIKSYLVDTINLAQLDILQRFADVRKDKNLNDIYKINDCEFVIIPKLTKKQCNCGGTMIPKCADNRAYLECTNCGDEER